MTPEEVNIAYKKQLPVTIKETMSNPDLKGGTYKICKFGNFYRKQLKQFEYYVAVQDPDNPKTIYELGIHQIEPLPGFELTIQKFINNKTKVLQAECARMIENNAS